jgi:hypothetical protein
MGDLYFLAIQDVLDGLFFTWFTYAKPVALH